MPCFKDPGKWRIKKRAISSLIYRWCVWAPGQASSTHTYRTFEEALDYYIEES